MADLATKKTCFPEPTHKLLVLLVDVQYMYMYNVHVLYILWYVHVCTLLQSKRVKHTSDLHFRQ